MKFTINTFILVFFTSIMFSQEDLTEYKTLTDTIIVNAKYSIQDKKPIIIEGFKYVKNNSSDKLYILNEYGNSYFHELIKSTKVDYGNDFEEILQSHINSIKEKDYLFNKLANKCSEQEKLFDNTIKEFDSNLKNLKSTVNLTQNSLLNANNTLDIVTKELKAHRKKQFWKNFGNVGTGAAIGLLLGVLIAN